jgi:tetratricopeptide (TPR) repeat protein
VYISALKNTIQMRVILVLLCILGILQGFSQSSGNKGNKFREDFTEANLLMDEGYYNQALELWRQLYNEDPSNANLNYKIGMCYLRSVNEKDEALQYLEFAEKSRTSDYSSFKPADYDPYDSRERNAPQETSFYIAEAYLLNYELDKAQLGFMTASDNLGKKHNLYEASTRGLEVTKNAKKQLAHPRMDITIINMGPTINDEYNDFSPVISVLHFKEIKNG